MKMIDPNELHRISGDHKLYSPTTKKPSPRKEEAAGESSESLFETEVLKAGEGLRLAEVLKRAAALPEVRQELVEKFRDAIENGTYQVNIDRIAKKLLGG